MAKRRCAFEGSRFVSTTFVDWQGQVAEVSAETIGGVLAAMGVDAADPAAALEAHWLAPWRRMLPACVVAKPQVSADAIATTADSATIMRRAVNNGRTSPWSATTHPPHPPSRLAIRPIKISND